MGRVRNVHGGTEEYTQTFSTGRKGPGGAYHHYEVWPNGSTAGPAAKIDFQQGPIQEVGINGCSNEDLLAIVADRLECFQKGKFACVDNAIALAGVHAALLHLNDRTKNRKKRGVEGKSAK